MTLGLFWVPKGNIYFLHRGLIFQMPTYNKFGEKPGHLFRATGCPYLTLLSSTVEISSTAASTKSTVPAISKSMKYFKIIKMSNLSTNIF